MHYRTTEQWAGFLSSVTCLCYFVQAALEEQCSEGHRATAVYFTMGINNILLTVAMWYGFVKDKSILVKLYIIATFMMGLGCLFMPALSQPASYGDHCYLAKFEPVVIGVLQLMTVGVVWRGLYVMSHVSSTAIRIEEATSRPETRAPEPVKSDDPPSYTDVVFCRSFSSPLEKSTAFTVPIPCESPQGLPYSYGSLNSMPPSYYLAVSQAPQNAANAVHLSTFGAQTVHLYRPTAVSLFNINEFTNTNSPLDNSGSQSD